MNANCPKCQQQTTFVSVKNKKYKCEKCNTVLHKCHKGWLYQHGCMGVLLKMYWAWF